MLIRINDIPKDGLLINDTIPLSALNERMAEGQDNDIEFIEDIRIKLRVHSRRGGAEVQGNVEAKYRQPCAKCLEIVETEIDKKLQYALREKPVEGQKGHKDYDAEAFSDDLGIAYYTGEHFDLEPLIQEELILETSPFGPKHKGCPGLKKLSASDATPSLGKTNALADQLKKLGV